MKGKITKTDQGWMVRYIDSVLSDMGTRTYYDKELPLHPDDVKQINKDAQVFDNIEARIAAYPDVEFEIVEEDEQDRYTNGEWARSYSTYTYAKLVNN